MTTNCKRCGAPTKHKIKSQHGGLCRQCAKTENGKEDEKFQQWREQNGHTETPYLAAMEYYLDAMEQEAAQ